MNDANANKTRDFTTFFRLLKLGALVNLWFLVQIPGLPAGADPHVVVPAAILFAVSGFRCLFPNAYKDNVVLHDTPLSSIFGTRVLATFSEVAYIYLFSHVLRLLNTGGSGLVEALSWLMVVEAVVSQGFVWGSILTGRLWLFFWEELGWFVLFAANTVASAWLLATVDGLGRGELLLWTSVVFGAGYLPWQILHLRMLRRDASARTERPPLTRALVADRLRRALHERNATSDGAAWGGWVGLTWMAGYWATLIPLWVYVVMVRVTT